MATRKRASARAAKSAKKAPKSAKKQPTKAPKSGRAPARSPKTTQRVHGAVYDPKTGRWREGGRYVSAPSSRKVRRDKAGRPIDGRGRRVPAESLSTPKRAPKKAPSKPPQKPRKRPKAPRLIPPPPPELPREHGRRKGLKLVPPLPRVVQLKPGRPVVAKEFVSSSFQNRKSPENAGEILSSMLQAQAAKGPFDAQDIGVFNFGLKFVGHEPIAKILPLLTADMPAGMSLEYSDTRAGTEVYLRLNAGGQPLLLDQVQSVLEQSKVTQYLERVYHELLDYWGDVEWYSWAEVEESLYG
jgi:hypothetical protein